MQLTESTGPPAIADGVVHGGDPDPATAAAERRSVLGDLREIAVGELWKYRELLYQLTLRNIRIRYKQAAMGFAWAILMPVLVVAAGVVVRFAMAYIGGGSVRAEQIAGIAVKALPWSFFVGALGFGVSSLTGSMTLITKIYFPRETLPVAAALAQAFDSAIGGLVLIIALPLLGVTYGVTALWAPLLILILVLFTIGISLTLGCANLFFRDVKYIVQVLLMFGIFVTPVFFEPAMFGPVGARVMMLNPLAPVLEGLRLSVVAGHDLMSPLVEVGAGGAPVLVWSPLQLLYSAAWALAAAVGGALVFHRLESVFAEYV